MDQPKRIYQELNDLYAIEIPFIIERGYRSYRPISKEGQPDILEIKTIKEKGFPLETKNAQVGKETVSHQEQITLNLANATGTDGFVRLGVGANSFRFISAADRTNQSNVDTVTGNFGAETIKAISDMAMFGKYLKINYIHMESDDKAFYAGKMAIKRVKFNGDACSEDMYYPDATPMDDSPEIRDVHFDGSKNKELYLTGDNYLEIPVADGRAVEMKIYAEWVNC